MPTKSITHMETGVVTPASRRVLPLAVMVPAYNEAASIGDTILSLQRQTLPPQEIIVIDDCSTDDTYAVAESY